MKTVLLTGATGFLGSHILNALLKDGYQVVILKRSTSDLWRIRHLISLVSSYDVDQEPIEKVFEKHHINSVIHTACHYGRNSDPAHRIVDTNLLFPLRLLDAAVAAGVKIFVNADTFFSLSQQYLNIYTLSKKQFVDWLKLKSSHIQVANLKIQHLYGPRDNSTKFVTWVVDQLCLGVHEIKLTSGEQRRDFVYVDDVVSAFTLMLEKCSHLGSYEEVDVGTGEMVSIKTFVSALYEAYEFQCGESKTFLNFGAMPCRPGEDVELVVDNSLITKLGWSPQVQLKDGLLNVVRDKLINFKS